MKTMPWPPLARDGSALAHAYVDLLGWQLLINGVPVAPEQAGCSRSGLVQIRCEGFDTITVPRALGSDVLLSLDRGTVRAPSLMVGRDAVTFLVQTDTGGCLAHLPDVLIEENGCHCLALPPSPGVRWDTPPWDVFANSPTPLEYPDARALLTSFETASRTRRGGP